jgi:hypothetical protein
MKNQMRKAIALALFTLSFVLLASCAADLGTGTGKPDKTVTPTDDVPQFVQFEEALIAEGIEWRKTEQTDAAKDLGARSGARYDIEDGFLILFRFSTDNERYIKIFNKRRVEIEVDGKMKEYPVVAYSGIVAILEDIEDAGTVQKIMAAVSDLWLT